MTSPALLKPVSVATLMIASCVFFDAAAITSTYTLSLHAALPISQAWLKNEPASTSACTIVWLAEHVNDAPGARTGRLVGGQLSTAAFGSVTVTPCRVTLPSLVATML